MSDFSDPNIFHNLPKQVTFSLNPNKIDQRGFCWFEGVKDIPSSSAIALRDYLGASEREINAFKDGRETDDILACCDIFNSRLVPASSYEPDENDEPKEIALGMDADGRGLLYTVYYEWDGMYLAGRTTLKKLSGTFECFELLRLSMNCFSIPPARLTSGRDFFDFDAEGRCKPREDELEVGPWRFEFVQGTTLAEMKHKAASTLVTLNPNRLWAVYMRVSEGTLRAAFFVVVNAGGKSRRKPDLLFEVETAVDENISMTPTPLRLGFFWQG